MKIATWNVNGIRSIGKKGFKDWILKNDFDIVTIQEAKAHMKDLKPADYTIPGYVLACWHEAVKKGYSGVATWVKEGISFTANIGLNIQEFDDEGRTNIIEFNNFILYSGYFPNGREDHSRVPYKLKYSYSVLDWAKKQSKPVIICGDLNTAHHSIDLANPKQNVNTTGFLPHERDFLDKMVEANYFDVVRKYNLQTNLYSWWSYRTAARKRNVGWRIDYFFAHKELEFKIKNAYNMTDQMGSDHCPIILEID